MASHGKRYRQARGTVDSEQAYSPVEAIRMLKDAPDAKCDETVEVHLTLGLNVRHADEQLRGTMMLPHGTGRTQRVAVFAEGDKAREAEEAGADVVGSADLAKRIEEGFTDFDVAIATPDQMGNVGRLGRVLGPRGLMPNPKTGTVTFDVAKAVKDAKAGKLEYRTDRGANVHIPIGKKSFDERSLVENYAALIEEIVRAKPQASKGRYIKKITLTSTMGPGIHVDPTRTRDSAETLFVADYRGLTMPQIDSLRGKLIENGARLSVVKNTLTRRAAEAAGADALLALLEGPSAIAFIEADGDMVAVAKALADSARETKVLEIRGGVMQGREISASDVEELAKLPPLDVLRGQVLGAIVAPLSSIAALVNAPLQNLYGLIEARIDQLQANQPEADSQEEPPANTAADVSPEPQPVEEAPGDTAADESQEPELENQPEADSPQE